MAARATMSRKPVNRFLRFDTCFSELVDELTLTLNVVAWEWDSAGSLFTTCSFD